MQKYGLIGYPLRHSFSIGYFNEKFKSENIDAEYVNFEIPNINDFMEVIEENPNLCGLNVTIPYKEQVIPFLDELDKDTAKIGAVNVIKIIRQPKGKVKLVGYNSDIIGFTQSIEPLLQPHHKKALIWVQAVHPKPSIADWLIWASKAYSYRVRKRNRLTSLMTN